MMEKLKSGIYYKAVADILTKLLQKNYLSSFVSRIYFWPTAHFHWLPWEPNAINLKKYLKNYTLRNYMRYEVMASRNHLSYCKAKGF